MKRFIFAEQSLLLVKQQEKQFAETEVLRASNVVSNIEQEIKDLELWMAESVNALVRSNQGSAREANEERRSFDSLGNARERLSCCVADLLAANLELEQARVALHNIQVECESLETLKAERFLVHKRIMQSQQQRLSDESTLRIWMNQQQEATDV